MASRENWKRKADLVINFRNMLRKETVQPVKPQSLGKDMKKDFAELVQETWNSERLPSRQLLDTKRMIYSRAMINRAIFLRQIDRLSQDDARYITQDTELRDKIFSYSCKDNRSVDGHIPSFNSPSTFKSKTTPVLDPSRRKTHTQIYYFLQSDASIISSKNRKSDFDTQISRPIADKTPKKYMKGKDNKDEGKEKMLGQPKQVNSCESEEQEDIMSKSEEAVVRNEKAPKIQSEQNSSVAGLSPIKSLHKARIQPTLPNLLTKYGLQVKDAVQTMKSAKRKEKKKKAATFEDEDEKEKEKNRQKEEKHLEIFHDMTRLRDYYYNEYMMLLQNKVQKQRQEIEQRSQAMNEKENRKKNRGPIAKRPERHNLSSNTSYLENIPKTDFYFIVQLQDKLVREGKLRTPTDLDAFWQKIQQPEVFYAHFKSQKCSDWRGEMSVHFNTMHDVLGNVPSTEELGPKTLSRITESRETLPASAGAAQSWAITQQFPAVNRGQNKSLLQGSKATQLPKSSFLTDLEKRFPKLEMPKLHCFTMDLGPKLPNPDEVTHQRHLRYLQNRRLAHMHNINKMHQIAMSYSAATTRILSKQDDLDFLWDGHQLTDLIPDHLLHSNSSGQEVYLPDISQTESLDFSPNCSLPVSYHTVNQHQHISQDNDSIHPNIVQLQDGGTMQTDLVIHGEVSRVNSRVSSRSKLKRGKAQQSKDTVDGDNIAVLPISDKPHTTHSSPIPLSLGEVIDKSRIIEAKCLSTLWTNYMKGEDAVQT